MRVPADAWVFDTGPLRHFAAQGWVGVLRHLAGSRPIVIPDVVERELRDAAVVLPAVHAVLDVPWISVHRSVDADFRDAFAAYEERLAVGRKNLGECGVLAIGEVFGAELVIDDSTPRTIAEEKGLSVTATVPILCDAIRAKQLTLPLVEDLADALLEGDYFLPFGPGGFRDHVLENGLLEWEDIA
jgi:predicted nucleic acid-binding protein